MDYKVLSSKYLVDGGVERITIDQAGSGYTSVPTVTITPAVGDDTGRGAGSSCIYRKWFCFKNSCYEPRKRISTSTNSNYYRWRR